MIYALGGMKKVQCSVEMPAVGANESLTTVAMGSKEGKRRIYTHNHVPAP